MTHNTTAIIVIAAILGLVPTGLSEGQEASVSLTIGSTAAVVGAVVEIPVTIAATDIVPNTVVFHVEFEPDVLAYDGFDSGDVITEGFLVSDSSDVGTREDHVAFIVYEFDQSFTGLEDGILLILRFEVLAEPPSGATTLHGANPSAAATGSEGEVINIPTSISDGFIVTDCDPPLAPENVDAGRQAGSMNNEVSWDPVQGDGIEYRVYRSVSNDPLTAVALADWSSATMFVDTNVPSNGGMGCPGEASGGLFVYYWVKARNTPGCESAFSASAAAPSRDAKDTLLATIPAGGDLCAVACLVAVLCAAGFARRRDRVGHQAPPSS